MEDTSYITIGLILGGASILLLAIARIVGIFKLLSHQKFRNNWRNLFILMGFFFVGYLGVVYIVYSGNSDLLLVLTGVIFFFGAVFVFLVVRAGFGTFKMLQELNKGLESKVSQLKIQNEEMSQFNYATSHDLQEPLNTLITSISIIKEDETNKLSETSNRLMNYSVKAADRMKDLIQSLSEYLKAGRNREYANTDLNELANEVLEEIQGAIQTTNATVKVSKLPTIYGNAVDIKRIFQNLISNAIKYRKSDVAPLIGISAEEKKGEKKWQFRFEDNGIGMSKEGGNVAFQIFKQLHPRDEYDGMGIGLSICKKVIEMHGGSIWLESEEGVGTTFFFTLRE